MNDQELIMEIIKLDKKVTELEILATMSDTNKLFMDYIYMVSKLLRAYKEANNLDNLFMNLEEYLENR